MADGFPESLTRTRYFANYTQGSPNDPNSLTFNPYDPQSVARQGTPAVGDIKVDVEEFLRPLERLHGMGAHGAGVAAGLQVGATIGQANVQIQPGIALDASGKHIFLAVGGGAELSPNADNYPNQASNKHPVTAQGVSLPTANLSGDRFVTIQWWEVFDQATWINSNGQVYQFDHTPWLRLLDAATLNQSQYALVVLAKVSLAANGTVTALTYGDPGGTQRISVSVPAQRVEFRRGVNTAGPLADSAAWGELSSREGGGLQMSVANSDDQVDIVQGSSGAFAQLNVGANLANFGNPNNPGVALSGASAACTIGTAGIGGSLIVKDSQNWPTFRVAGDQGSVSVGASNVPGRVNVLDQNGNTSLELAGANGSAVVRRVDPLDGQLIDVGARFFRIHGWDLVLDGRSGNNNRALVDLGNKLIINFAGDYPQGVQVDGVLQDGNGVPLMGNPVRKVGVVWLFSTDGTPNTVDVPLPRPSLFTAIGSLVMINSTTDFDYDNGVYVDVYRVDGNDTAGWVSGAGSNFGGPGDPRNMRWPSIVSGFGQRITFRTFALGPDIQCAAIGIVFYE